MPKPKQSRKLKTYGFRVILEGVGELKARRPFPQDKVLKMAREKLDKLTDDTLTDFTMGVSPLTLIEKKKKTKPSKGKKPKGKKRPKAKNKKKKKKNTRRKKPSLRLKRKK